MHSLSRREPGLRKTSAAAIVLLALKLRESATLVHPPSSSSVCGCLLKWYEKGSGISPWGSFGVSESAGVGTSALKM